MSAMVTVALAFADPIGSLVTRSRSMIDAVILAGLVSNRYRSTPVS
jgi:hypothetical protein